MKPTDFILILCFSLCSKSLQAQQRVTDSLLKEVILSVYPAKSYLKIEVSGMPSKIESRYNWENEDDAYKGTIFRDKHFDSLFIKQQLSEREIIYIDSLIERKPIEIKRENVEFVTIEYILFSKDLKKVIIKEMHYCGEDCGSEMISLYEKRKGNWVFGKGIIGGIY